MEIINEEMMVAIAVLRVAGLSLVLKSEGLNSPAIPAMNTKNEMMPIRPAKIAI